MNLLKIIEYIESYDMSKFTERLIDKFNFLDEYEINLIIESLKDFYISVYIANSEGKFINSITNAIVDELWHLHILHTKEYFNFCENVYGRYLHHTPTDNIIDSVEQPLRKYYDSFYIHRNYQLVDLNQNKDRICIMYDIVHILNGDSYSD